MSTYSLCLCVSIPESPVFIQHARLSALLIIISDSENRTTDNVLRDYIIDVDRPQKHCNYNHNHATDPHIKDDLNRRIC